MKKGFFFLLFFCCFMLSAKEIAILCTTQPVWAMTNAVVGKAEGFRTELLLPPSVGCPHDYALTPHDVQKLYTADVIVINGLGMENFLKDTLQKTGKRALIIDSSNDVPGKLVSECEDCHEHHGHKHDEHKHEGKHEHHADSFNEHLFASPSMAAAVVCSIAKQLGQKYPAKKAVFEANAKIFSEKLLKIALEYASFGKKIPQDRRNAALQHGIFDYLARDTGFHVEAYLQEHVSNEPSASEIIKLVKKLKKHKVSVILAEKGYPGKVTELVASEAKIPVVTLSAYLSGKDASSPEAFLRQFTANLEQLKRAFGR